MGREIKLHEVLAFEGDAKKQASSLVQETFTTFAKKDNLFDGLVKIYHSIEENGDEIPPEEKAVTTTVPEKINHVMRSVVDAIDVTLTKEETNSSGNAKAELIIDGNSFGELSATGLLSLENNLTRLRNELYKSIPTLDPTTNWMKDTESNRPGMFKSSPMTKYRTVNRKRPIVAYEATKEHPAQIAMESYDEQVGRYETTSFSGKIRPIQKSAIIERLDKVIMIVKQTRARANNVPAQKVQVASKLFEYIHGSDLA